ncbi:hypothetical protein SAMN05518668_105357 [Sphingobium sp. YR657]|uniref:Uncharacterized protein n=1 Tax=Sphingobium yanoikuyae ATCC 51230 TaxID=883163 RepID=K9CRI9_SPHYA|nr:hypothetical protein HMPREF9718_04040 [Sphingobium yanoikuyae ATCC 51230]SHM08939.1 hypothetical protein SAMN05518668_105357 [Sphingobium sp. YR657]
MMRVPPHPFALSLSKGSADRREAASLRSVEGFDFAQPERGKEFD